MATRKYVSKASQPFLWQVVSPSLEDLDGEVRVPVDGPVQVWADGAIHWLGRETGDVGDDDGDDGVGDDDGDDGQQLLWHLCNFCWWADSIIMAKIEHLSDRPKSQHQEYSRESQRKDERGENVRDETHEEQSAVVNCWLW